MRHIKLFENFEDNEIEYLCNNYLAYLKDDGFDVYVNELSDRYSITIRKEEWGDMFDWEIVSDYLSPFLEVLSDKYQKIEDVIFYRKSIYDDEQLVSKLGNIRNSHEPYSIDKILNSNFSEYDIISISINIKKLPKRQKRGFL